MGRGGLGYTGVTVGVMIVVQKPRLKLVVSAGVMDGTQNTKPQLGVPAGVMKGVWSTRLQAGVGLNPFKEGGDSGVHPREVWTSTLDTKGHNPDDVPPAVCSLVMKGPSTVTLKERKIGLSHGENECMEGNNGKKMG